MRAVPLVGLGMPAFWLGIMLLLLLAAGGPKLFPVGGYGEGVLGHLVSMFLPALTVAIGTAPLLIRSLRVSLLAVLESDYVTTARAKGIPERRVLIHHALRNAIMPMITVLGINLGFLIGTTVVVEKVFALPGVGALHLRRHLAARLLGRAGRDTRAGGDRHLRQHRDRHHVFAARPAREVRLMSAGRTRRVWSSPRRSRGGARFRNRWYRTPSFVAGAIIVLTLALASAAAPLIAPYDPDAQDLLHTYEHSSSAHWLGTDQLGRDVTSRLIYAGRVDLLTAFLAVLIPFFLGTILGLLAGYYGRSADTAVMRLVDVVVAFPSLVLVLALVFVLGAGQSSIVIAIACVGWVSYTRIVRAEVLVHKRLEYVLAAKRRRALGHAASWRATSYRT